MASNFPPTDRILPPAPKKRPVWTYFLLGLITGMAGLAVAYGFLKESVVLEKFFSPPVRPYAAYVAALENNHLAESAMGKAWIEAGANALADSTQILPPHLESGYVAPLENQVISYQIRPRKGQLLSVWLELVSVIDSPQVFIELFELDPDGQYLPEVVAFADSCSYYLQYQVEEDEVYLLRIQPELLARFSYRLQVVLGASLAFPVAGKDSKAIRSFWGDSREGGRRQHKGVDIFARRGTPVLAASDGEISRIRNGGLGGKVVWQRDAYQPQSLYYAHLDTQWVRRGQRVKAGDTLGLVGNTGNARFTPPHLHFGVYQRRRGAVDPFPFVDQPPQTPPTLVAADSGMLCWFRISRNTAMFPAPSAKAEPIQEIPLGSPVRRLSASGKWHLVQLPDGSKGYIAHTDADGAERPLEIASLGQKQFLYDHVQQGVITDSLEAGSEIDILAQTNLHRYIRTKRGQMGWIINLALNDKG